MADTLDYHSAFVPPPANLGVYYGVGDSPGLFIRTFIALLDMVVAIVAGVAALLVVREIALGC